MGTILKIDITKDEVELLIAQPSQQSSGEATEGEDGGEQSQQSGQQGQQSGNSSGQSGNNDQQDERPEGEDSEPQTDDMPQNSGDDSGGQQQNQSGQQGQQNQSGQQQSGEQDSSGQQSSQQGQQSQSGQKSGQQQSGEQDSSGQQGQQSQSGQTSGNSKSANEREAEEQQAAKDALNRLAGVDNKEEADKQASNQASTERGTIASDSPVTSKDIGDISQDGKSKESKEESDKIDNAAVNSSGSTNRDGSPKKSTDAVTEITDYYAKYAGFRSKLMDEEDTVSKLQRILSDALSTKSTYDDTAPRRDAMYKDAETGNRYFVLGAEKEVTVPTEITLILDCSSSMSMTLFKHSMFAIVQILTKFDMALEVVHVITFGQNEAAHGLLRFSGSGFHPKFFYNRVDQMYDAQSKIVESGGTLLYSAYRHAQAKCKNSTLLFVFSDFQLHDSESSIGIAEYAQLKRRMRYFSPRTIYVKVPDASERSSASDTARTIKSVNAAMQDLDPSWLKRKCTLAEAARAFDAKQK